jgi:hypothetical protein
MIDGTPSKPSAPALLRHNSMNCASEVVYRRYRVPVIDFDFIKKAKSKNLKKSKFANCVLSFRRNRQS